jgi:hypothetical protein
MFGMLDYRAYKLFWLLTFPFRLAGRAFYFIFLGIAIWIGIWTEYQPLILQMVIAYVAFEAMFLVFGILWWLVITWPIEKIFFWTVDVIPSKGADAVEAKEIVRRGGLHPVPQTPS